MAVLSSRVRFSTMMVIAGILVMQMGRGIFAGRRVDVPGPSALLEYVTLLTLIGYWLEVDSRGREFMRIWDLGFLLCIGWPVLLPYYLVKTRGLKRGLGTIFGLILFYFFVFAATAAVYMIFSKG